MSKYKWQGKPVKTEFGYMKVTENKEKPMCWYNYECYWDSVQGQPRYSTGDKWALIPAIRITSGNHTWCISNHFGIGVNKLINGGWPSHAHFSFYERDEFVPNLTNEERQIRDIRKFDLEGFEVHESARRNWQKKIYPKEFEKSEALRNQILSLR